jgi:hypothetical protein
MLLKLLRCGIDYFSKTHKIQNQYIKLNDKNKKLDDKNNNSNT